MKFNTCILSPKLVLLSALNLSFIMALGACSILHRTQISEIDSSIVKKGHRFEIQISETGVNLQELGSVARLFTNDVRTSDQMRSIQEAIALFQMGPRTGNMVFNDRYPGAVPGMLLSRCPSGHISGLMSIRETAKYPVVSGEIIRLVGYCQN